MNPKKYLENRIRGWLPKEPSISYAHKLSKPKWKQYLKTVSIVAGVVLLAGIIFVGARTYMRYSNPAMDVAPSPYYEKTTNSTTVGISDVIEVNVWVHWHGHVFPEFQRNVKIVDPFPDGYFTLADETNIVESSGYGGSYHLKYLLRAVDGEGVTIELPKPRLYLDSVEVPLSGSSPTLHVSPK
jgi:hypothetical protein